MWYVQAYKGKSQHKAEIDKGTSKSTGKRSHDAMEETDGSNCEGDMDVCISDCKDNKQNGICQRFCVPSSLCFACS